MNEPDNERTEPEIRAQNGALNFTRYMIGGLCLVLFLALTAVGYVQVEERRGGGLRPFVSAENKKCIDCHMKGVPKKREKRVAMTGAPAGKAS